MWCMGSRYDSLWNAHQKTALPGSKNLRRFEEGVEPLRDGLTAGRVPKKPSSKLGVLHKLYVDLRPQEASYFSWGALKDQECVWQDDGRNQEQSCAWSRWENTYRETRAASPVFPIKIWSFVEGIRWASQSDHKFQARVQVSDEVFGFMPVRDPHQEARQKHKVQAGKGERRRRWLGYDRG